MIPAEQVWDSVRREQSLAIDEGWKAMRSRPGSAAALANFDAIRHAFVSVLDAAWARKKMEGRR